MGARIVAALGPKGAYAIGRATGLGGAALLMPMLRWLPEQEAAVGHIERSEPREVAELLPFDPPE